MPKVLYTTVDVVDPASGEVVLDAGTACHLVDEPRNKGAHALRIALLPECWDTYKVFVSLRGETVLIKDRAADEERRRRWSG